MTDWEVDSFPCGIYWQDGFSTHKTDPKIKLYCQHTTIMEPVGIGIEVKCIAFKMYMPFILEEVCEFSYSSPVVPPID